MVLDKKGQVTIFVILGLVVFVLVLITFFFVFDREEPDPNVPIFTEYPARLSPMVANVEQCLYDLTKDALVVVGLQGGYLNTSVFVRGLEPGFLNNALEIFPGSNQVVPYWYYVSGNPGSSDVSLELAYPSLDIGEVSIKVQVEDYVDNNLLSCLNNFDDYDEQFLVSFDEHRTQITFTDFDVFVELFWGLNVTFYDGDASIFMNKFSSRVDLDFRKTFDLAKQVLLETQLYSDVPFFDDYTIKVIELVGAGGKDAIIPPVTSYTDSEVGASKIWNLADAKNILVEELSDNSNYLQVLNARDSFIPITSDTYANLIYGGFVFNMVDADELKLQESRISFEYMPNWPFYVSVKPGYGPIITTSPKVEFDLMGLFNFALTEYKFYYDVAYPILVTIENPSAFQGEGYVFRYVVEVNLRQNKPFSFEFDEFDLESYDSDLEYFDGFRFMDQRTIPFSARVVNGYTGDVVEGFVLAYTCLDDTITVGESKLEEGFTYVKGFIPPCIGGEFHSSSLEYFASYDLSAMVGESYDFELAVYPEKEIVVRPRKMLFTHNNVDLSDNLDNLDDRVWSLEVGSSGNPIDLNEEISIMFLSRDNPSFIRFLELEYPDTEARVSLLPGTYDFFLVSKRVLGENEENPVLRIPEKNYTVSGGFLADLFSGKEEVTFNETVFNDTVVNGGLFLMEEEFLVVSANDLKNNNIMTIFYPGFNTEDIEYHHDLAVMGDVFDLKPDQKSYFVPKFER